jgi:hypothetical protein
VLYEGVGNLQGQPAFIIDIEGSVKVHVCEFFIPNFIISLTRIDVRNGFSR